MYVDGYLQHFYSKISFLSLILYTFTKFSIVYRILVGAPIGKNLQPKTNQSGALYKCPLTSFHDDCIQVVTDGKRSKYSSFFN